MNTIPEQSSNYISANDDRDYLLDYKSIDTSTLERVDLLDVMVDNVTRDEAVARILSFLEDKSGVRHIFFADPIKLMRIRPGKKGDFIYQHSSMILADGAGLEWASRKLGNPLKERIPMIALIMDLVRLSTIKNYTIYLFGSRGENVEKVFFNLQRSFPGLRVIGRQSGHFDKQREGLIKESLRKSSPDIILLGMGFPKQEKWIHENRAYLGNAVVLGVDGFMDILSGNVKKAPDWAQLRGLTWFWRTITRPWMVHRWWYMYGFFIRSYFRSIGKKSQS